MATPVPNANLHESEQDVTLKATIPFAVIAVISVVCRFIARRIQKLNFEFDDYMIVAGLIFTLGCFALSMEMVHFGSGKHLAAVPLSNIPQYFKCLFAYEFLYSTSLLAIKLSVLSFYRRIFSIARFKLAANIVAAVVVAWWIAVILVSIFSCNPINGFWDKAYTRSKCISTEHFYIGNAVPNIVTDIVILVLPLREIWRLNTQRHQKIALSCIFLLGSFVIVASLVRLTEQFKVNDPDFTWAMNGTVIWSSIEPSCGVISSCLPTLRPLALRLFPKLASSGNRYAVDPRRKNYADIGRGYAERSGITNNIVFADGPNRTVSSHQKNFDPERHDVLLDQISVQKDVHLTSEIL